jgi:hypothetical protein
MREALILAGGRCAKLIGRMIVAFAYRHAI